MDLLSDKRFEFLFEREDANGVRVMPQDVVIAIKDWVDEDETQSAFNPNNAVSPFAAGFSDENGPYEPLRPALRGEERALRQHGRAVPGARGERPLHGGLPGPAHRVPGHQLASPTSTRMTP